MNAALRANGTTGLRAFDGVVSVHMAEGKPHPMGVRYDPARIPGVALLQSVPGKRLPADRVGF